MKWRLLFLLTFLKAGSLWAQTYFDISKLKGENFSTGKVLKSLPSKATVIVFLSATCPCSRSHQKYLNALAERFKEFNFIGLHSNQDEDLDASRNYFEAAQLSFPVLHDENALWAIELKALKTPHAFILSEKGALLYSGGVSSSHVVEKAKNFPLAQALENLQKGEDIKVSRSRSLGCVIQKKKAV